MSAKHTPGHQWLKGTGGTEFLQFANTRVTRTPFPLGGYIYHTRASPDDGRTLYSGNDERAAIAKATEGAA